MWLNRETDKNSCVHSCEVSSFVKHKRVFSQRINDQFLKVVSYLPTRESFREELR
jgi:hypothetical protein